MSVVNQSQNNEEVQQEDVQQLITTDMYCIWADPRHVTSGHV